MTETSMPSLRVARNIIKKHGHEKFVRLLSLFEEGVSGTDIAAEFGVCRQRVNQWKQKLGTRVETYVIEPAVENLLYGRSRRTVI